MRSSSRSEWGLITKLQLPNSDETAASKSRPNIRNQSQNLDQNSASKSRSNLSLKLLTKLQLQTSGGQDQGGG